MPQSSILKSHASSAPQYYDYLRIDLFNAMNWDILASALVIQVIENE